MQSPPLSLIMRKSGDLWAGWESEKLVLEIFWQNCHRMTSYVPLALNKRGKPISDICNFTTMTNNDGGQYYLETFLGFSPIGRPRLYLQVNREKKCIRDARSTFTHFHLLSFTLIYFHPGSLSWSVSDHHRHRVLLNQTYKWDGWDGIGIGWMDLWMLVF